MEDGNTGWQPISTAPQDGTPIQARIMGYGDDHVIRWTEGFMNSEEEDCGCWTWVSGKKEPACWHDGVCWAVNADEVASAPPTHWRPAPDNEQEPTA